MATVSSHILDSVSGRSAQGIRCQLNHVDNEQYRTVIFDIVADDEGRIAETVVTPDTSGEYELIFYAAEYFAEQGLAASSTVKKVVIQFDMNELDKRYHLPIMLAPHSYSTWWSE
ncbi:MAG: 5-hydroxyisourate hydrolase [Gammaproteobacteria bacterium]|jgi:5-hydroxyisourate hydrolase